MRHTFIMRTNYDDIFQALPAAQAGELIQAVYAYVSGRDIPAFSAPAVEIAFKCLHKDLAYDVSKYEEVCAKRAAAGRKGGRSKKTKCLPSENSEVSSKAKHDEDEYEDEEMRRDNNINIFTVPPALAQDTPDFSGGNSKALADVKPPKDKHLERAPLSKGTTPLHAFARQVLEHFEPSIDDTQQDIWFKRNCRCLKDILDFCHGDTRLALTTIDVCLDSLENTGFNCGYEAVARNITNYYTEAEKRVREASYGR